MGILFSRCCSRNIRQALRYCISCFIITAVMQPGTGYAQSGMHLFILSGQSNMAELKPEESFTPMLSAAFGANNIIVVKDAMGSQPIRRWYKDWQTLKKDTANLQPDLYDSLIKKVRLAIQGKKIKSVTFVWMQGERDAREGNGDVYEQALAGLYKQLCRDLNREDVHFIIGRLSDFDLSNTKYPHWTRIREIQEKAGSADSKYAWINTDDLNDGFDRRGKAIANDLHMSKEGYVILGARFAEKAILIINKHSSQ